MEIFRLELNSWFIYIHWDILINIISHSATQHLRHIIEANFFMNDLILRSFFLKYSWKYIMERAIVSVPSINLQRRDSNSVILISIKKFKFSETIHWRFIEGSIQVKSEHNGLVFSWFSFYDICDIGSFQVCSKAKGLIPNFPIE